MGGIVHMHLVVFSHCQPSRATTVRRHVWHFERSIVYVCAFLLFTAITYPTQRKRRGMFLFFRFPAPSEVQRQEGTSSLRLAKATCMGASNNNTCDFDLGDGDMREEAIGGDNLESQRTYHSN